MAGRRRGALDAVESLEESAGPDGYRDTCVLSHRRSPKLTVVTALVERTALCTSMKRSEPFPVMWIRVARAVPELIPARRQYARPERPLVRCSMMICVHF